MSRLVPLSLALAALAACSDGYPAAPSFAPPTPEQVIALEMVAGDSLDIGVVAAERLGMLGVSSCSSAAPAVADVNDSGRLVALTAGDAVIRCLGTLDSRIDPTIDGRPDDGAGWRWVTFDVHLSVVPLEGPPDEPGEPA